LAYYARMLSMSLTFFVLALIAAFFGFSGIAGAAVGIAKFLFVIFVILFIASFFFRAADAIDRSI